MRFQNKYKKFFHLTLIFREFPKKILKFHQTKWKKIQQLNKNVTSKKIWSINKSVISTKFWLNNRQKYQIGLSAKRYFDCLFDQAFSIVFFKNLKNLNKKANLIIEQCTYLIRPEFRIDNFLWRFNFFSTRYEARNFINLKKIKVNGKVSHPNYFLKKGDIIFFDYDNFFFDKNYRNFLSKKINNNSFATFIEIDYYTNTIVMLKNYHELTENDIFFFVDYFQFYDVNAFKHFIE